MKFMIGLPVIPGELTDLILRRREQIYEVYFSWGDFANGRADQTVHEDYTPWELQKIKEEALGRFCENGIPLNLLFNGNCYGKDSLSEAFFDKIGMTVDYLVRTYRLASITTTSPLIARFIKEYFPTLKTRASVNIGVGTPQAASFLAADFDGFYLKREYNRDMTQVKRMHDWCEENGKELFLLANSGCLNDCPARTFHDNLVSHETEIASQKNRYTFTGLCHEYLRDPSHYDVLLTGMNFIRPEDIEQYAPYVTAIKLATRVNDHPCAVVDSYLDGRYSGDLLRLLEPAHRVYPYVLENGEPMRLVKLPDIPISADETEGFFC